MKTISHRADLSAPRSQSSPVAFEFTDTPSRLDVQESEYRRLLGYPPDTAASERAHELAAWARRWYSENGRPWIFARAAGGLEIGAGKIHFGHTDFISDRLHEQFAAADAHEAVLVAVSAGKECEDQARQCWQEGKPDEYFFLEMFGSAVVEHLVMRAAGRICAWADENRLAVLPHYSPGYSGWPVSDQPKLWRMIRGNNGAPFPADLDVMETGMLRPKKSLLTIFGLTRHTDRVQPGSKLIPCENCSWPDCQYRRAPYRFFMPQAEMVGRPQNDFPNGNLTPNATGPVLDKLARYSLNARALKKWSQERLQLETAANGWITARFRFEGTTCSNLGRLIEYDYHVRLRPRAQAYRIAETRCVPAEGDTGHAQQCEFLRDAERFTKEIAAENPLANCPLNEVLAWKRSGNPAGCLCEAGSREHKWGMVLEVIHFALAQKGAS